MRELDNRGKRILIVDDSGFIAAAGSLLANAEDAGSGFHFSLPVATGLQLI